MEPVPTTSDPSDLDLLRRVRELIANGWCQHCSAKDPRGSPINALDPRAVAFCLGGAVSMTALLDRSGYDSKTTSRLIGKLYAQLTPDERGNYKLLNFPPLWNDQGFRTQAQVLALVDRAIAAERAERGVAELLATLGYKEPLPEPAQPMPAQPFPATAGVEP